MKKITLISLIFCFGNLLYAQNKQLVGRWTGTMGKQQITIVFAADGSGIWKAQTLFSAMRSCKCNIEVSSPITWKVLSSTKIRINYVSSNTGNYNFTNDDDCKGDYPLNKSMCEGMNKAMLADYTDKTTVGPFLYEDKDTIWIDGYEFSKE